MRKFNVAAKVLGVGLSLGLGLVAAAPAAQAGSFLPQQEGEIGLKNINFLNENDQRNIDTSELGFSVTSLKYSEDYGLSRLFVDQKGTENQYGSGIKFQVKDQGTNEKNNEFMFRSVAYDKDGNPVEGGELEIGSFLFEFDRAYEKIELDFLDVETSGFSGILKVNGESVSNKLLAAGKDNEIQKLTLENVSSFEIQLGDPSGFNGVGDGVNLSGIQSVPEPTTTFSLGALAVAGMFGMKKRKKFKM